MNRPFLYLTLLGFALIVRCNVNKDTINPSVVISKVERKIDISSHLVKSASSLTVENTGKSGIKSFLYAIEPSLQKYLSFIGASIKDDDNKLTVSKTAVDGHGDKEFWRINLPSSLAAGKSVQVDVDSVYAHALAPFPTKIKQSEKQLVVFTGNVFLYSPYKITSQTTTVNLASSSIESYSKSPKPVSQSEKTVTYGPYEAREPFTEAELRVHAENNNPFLTVTHLERVIELSHWGNIAVEENIQMRHSGADLSGPFSRYDYQRTQDAGASIKSFKTVLPASAKDVYYRDEIGNISTSHLKELDDMVEVELRPRFPLFGGWKTQYLLGYNVPSYQYLYNQGNQYALKMRFVDHIFDDVVIDEMTVKIILPEGAKNTKLVTPFSVKKDKNSLHFTYLDTVGRPVIVAHKTNLVDAHIQDFELWYTFDKYLLLQEPLLVVIAFYLLFLCVIIYVRMDFSITKDEAKESKMRVASILEEVQSLQDKRSALYQSFDDAVNKFKSTKDATNFTNSRKKIDGDYKQLTQQIQGLQSQLKNEGADAAEKVGELQRLDTQHKDLIAVAIQYSEKLVNNKMTRQAYIDQEKANNTKREELLQKMESVRASL